MCQKLIVEGFFIGLSTSQYIYISLRVKLKMKKIIMMIKITTDNLWHLYYQKRRSASTNTVFFFRIKLKLTQQIIFLYYNIRTSTNTVIELLMMHLFRELQKECTSKTRESMHLLCYSTMFPDNYLPVDLDSILHHPS